MTGLIDRVKLYWALLTALILTSIILLSLWPADALPPVPGSDKTHHLIAYTVLVLPVALRKPKHWLLIVLLFIACSGLIELIQPFVNRYGEWLDMLANNAGVICGIIIASTINFFFAGKVEGNAM